MRWSTLYAVYFNNLKSSDVMKLDNQSRDVARYRGYVDVSYGGPVRDYLARTLGQAMILCDGRAIVAHDHSDEYISNDASMGFRFPELGYETVSLIGEYFYAMLSYKVEVSHSPRADTDRLLNLAALTGHPIDVDRVPIVVPSDKLTRYLLIKEDKLRLMTDAGLQDVTPTLEPSTWFPCTDSVTGCSRRIARDGVDDRRRRCPSCPPCGECRHAPSHIGGLLGRQRTDWDAKVLTKSNDACQLSLRPRGRIGLRYQ